MTTVPAAITWPLLALMAVIVVVRYAFFRSSSYERYLNRTLSLLLLANLLREPVIDSYLIESGLLTIADAQQISLVLLIFACTEFMGFVTVWANNHSGASSEGVRRRHFYHRVAAAVLAAAFIAAGTPARNAGQTLEQFGGWTSVTAWVFDTTIYVAMATMLIRMVHKELIRPDAHRNERLVAVAGYTIAISIIITCVEAVALNVFENLNWLHSVDFRLKLHGSCIFWESTLAIVLGTVPVVLALNARVGWDATSRNWRRLQPLKESMIEAVPSVAFELQSRASGRQKTSLDLHQVTVQIRDAILRLRGYVTGIDDDHIADHLRRWAVPEEQRDAAAQALRLAWAINAKNSGVDPTPLDTSTIVQSRSTTLEEETAELLRLATWWPEAQAAVRQRRTAQPQSQERA